MSPTCVATDVDPQGAVAGELLATVRADFLLLSRVGLQWAHGKQDGDL